MIEYYPTITPYLGPDFEWLLELVTMLVVGWLLLTLVTVIGYWIHDHLT